MVFVIYFDKGVFGVAVATLIAQGAAAMLSFCLLMKKLQGYGSGERYAFYDKEIAASMVKIAIPSTLQQSIVHMGILLVQSLVHDAQSKACRENRDVTHLISLFHPVHLPGSDILRRKG